MRKFRSQIQSEEENKRRTISQENSALPLPSQNSGKYDINCSGLGYTDLLPQFQYIGERTAPLDESEQPAMWQTLAPSQNSGKNGNYCTALGYTDLQPPFEYIGEHTPLDESGQPAMWQTLAGSAQNTSVEIHRHPQQWRNMGPIRYDPKTPLGEGNGTKVFKGAFGARPVAVKRISCDHSEVEKFYAEIAMLVEIDAHPNIVTYFTHEVLNDDDPKIFIAMELCDINLHEWAFSMKVPSQFDTASIDKIDVLRQITRGVDFLHSRKIIHRDIKPENVLLKTLGKETMVKVSDFGISRKVPDGRTSVTNKTTSGTDGWMAPEILRCRLGDNLSGFIKLRTSSDIFSLGCLFYFVLAKGAHIFGENIRRNVNILDDKRINQEEKLESTNKQYVTFINRMTSKVPEYRPSAASILEYYMFMSSKEQLDFLVRNSDMLNNFCEYTVGILKIMHKRMLGKLDKECWINFLDPVVSEYLKSSKRRKYTHSFHNLLRAVRNLNNHYWELPREVQSALGKPPDAFLHYWIIKFPWLIDYLRKTLSEYECSGISSDEYYPY